MGIGTFVDALNQAANNYTAISTNFTLRTVILSTILSNPGKKYCRITYNSQNVTNGLTVDNAFIGLQGAGDAYDFLSTPTRVTFDNGNNGFAIGINAQKVSDIIEFTIPAATNIVCTAHTSANSGLGGRGALGTGNRLYFKSGVDEAGTVNVTGYTASTDGVIWPIVRIEVADEEGGNFQTAMILGE